MVAMVIPDLVIRTGTSSQFRFRFMLSILGATGDVGVLRTWLARHDVDDL